MGIATLAPLTIAAIGSDTGDSASDFHTMDQSLVYSGSLPATLAAGEKVRVEILSADGQTVVASGFATVEGDTWTLDKTSMPLPTGQYTIKATVVSATDVPVASYGEWGVAQQPMWIDKTAPNNGTAPTRSADTRLARNAGMSTVGERSVKRDPTLSIPAAPSYSRHERAWSWSRL
jgi:hypothetical protein